ncbi:MAG: flagellar biosynthetic protein FliR, partial [Halanaerobiaceae bacterium]
GQFKNIAATLVFLAVNGHLIVVRNLYRTFRVIPPGGAVFPHNLWQFLFRESGNLFVIAFTIALPVIGTVFVVDVILGFLARSVPQMNIFIVGLPIKIIIGFVLLLFSFHIIISFYNDLFQQTLQDMIKLIRFMGG